MDLEHEKRLTEVEERSKSNTKRIDKIEKEQNELGKIVSAVSALAEREKNVEADVKEIKADVKEINSKPAKKWDSLLATIIAAVVTGLVCYILGRIGLK